MVGPRASESLRLRLAEHLDDLQVPLETAQLIEPLLANEDPRNLSAQLTLYKNQHTSREVRERIEGRLASWSTQALAHWMGVPGETGGTSSGGFGASGFGFGRGGGSGRRFAAGMDFD